MYITENTLNIFKIFYSMSTSAFCVKRRNEISYIAPMYIVRIEQFIAPPTKLEGTHVFMCIGLSVLNKESSNSCGWMFAKLSVNDHLQNIFLEFYFRGTQLSASGL